MNNNMKFIKHENTWPWGRSTIIITNDACGTVTVQFSQSFPDEGFITSLSVHKSKRNKGYGNMLLAEAEKYALENGVTQTALRCDPNSWVIEWYKRHGYVLEGFTFGEDEDMFPILSKKLI